MNSKENQLNQAKPTKLTLLKRRLAPYFTIVGTGYGAFAAIRQVQHPTVAVPHWLLWTGAVVTSLLFVVRLIVQTPEISLVAYRLLNRGRGNTREKTS